MSLHHVAPPELPVIPGISASVLAVILIRATGCHGELVRVADLAKHLGCSIGCVRRHCEHLVARGALVATHDDGVSGHLGDITAVSSVLLVDDVAPSRH